MNMAMDKSQGEVLASSLRRAAEAELIRCGIWMRA